MSSNENLLLRNDTFFGVCEGIGQDFGFHSNWLRIALALGFYFSPFVIVGIYLGLGALVAGSRFAFPARPAAAVAPAEQQADVAESQGMLLAA
ncbi:MAG: PspC domain-containing protein [Sphingomicrobium sp.]